MLRVAMLGAGWITNSHFPGWQQLRDAEVVLVCDVRSEVAAAQAQRYGVARTSADYREALADPAIDAVDICLPHDLHVQVALEALAAGKHVLIEKPIAISVAEARRVIAAADASDRVYMVAENWDYQPIFQEAARLVREGAIGAPLLLRAHMEFVLPAELRTPGAWRLQGPRVGGGVLLDSGVHVVSAARLLFGEISEVAGVQEPAAPVDGVPMDESFVLAGRFASGALASLTISRVSPRPTYYNHFVLIGQEGLLEFDIDGDRILHTRDGQRREIAVPARDGFADEIAAFVRYVQEGSQPLTSAREQARSIAVVEAAYRAAASGQRQPVERID